MKTEVQTSAPSIPSFSLDDFNAVYTAKMEIAIAGSPTGWFWEFAGPGHPLTVAYNDARARERLQEEARREQAIANGKKYKPAQETVDEVKARNINIVVSRLVGWSDVEIDGKKFEFSAERARDFLANPARGAILVDALEFLFESSSFTKRLPTI